MQWKKAYTRHINNSNDERQRYTKYSILNLLHSQWQACENIKQAIFVRFFSLIPFLSLDLVRFFLSTFSTFQRWKFVHLQWQNESNAKWNFTF